MTQTKRSLFSITALLALTSILSSCAVLTIDVDVYKGALINEEHVQLHQIAGVVEATKPLLVQLRDSLEWPDSDGLPPKGATGNPRASGSWFDGEWISPSACTSTETTYWYKAEYIPPPSLFVPEYRSGGRTLWEALPYVRPTCYNFFTKPHAQQVNQLLKLYEDLDKAGVVIQENEADKKQISQCKAQQPTQSIPTTLGLSTRLKKLKSRCPNQLGHKNTEQLHDHEDIDALVEFAQQVLFLANHDGLLARPSTPGLITGGLTDLNRILFGDALTDYKYSPYRLFQNDVFESKQIQYVRVLQAVGNSILFAANELREREGYKSRMEQRTPAEVDAANASRSLKDPITIFQELLKDLDQQAEEAKKVAKETDTQLTNMSTSDIAGFRANNKGLAELAALLTQAYINEIKPQLDKFKADKYATFLTGTREEGSLAAILEARSAALQSTDPELTLQITDAVAFLKRPDTEEGFKAYCKSQGTAPLPKEHSKLVGDFAKYIEQLNSHRAVKEASLMELQNTRATLEEKKGLNQAKETRFNQTKKTISEIQSLVLERAGKIGTQLTTGDLYNLVRLTLSEPTDTKNKIAHEDARKVLDALPAAQANAPLNKDDYKSPLEVMDRIIAELRHNHIRVIELEGEKTENSQRASNALENARRHRAGMIYLRPASAYLRTSFPSTSLQDDPNLAWDNLLLQQGIRSLPFSSQLRDMLDPIQKQDRSLTAELDKQYWQNINRVRVSGAGLTNQVVAKDDVGNWYVKQYYGDTESIAKGAKNLALFSLGTKLPIDVPTVLKKINQDDNTKKPAALSDDGNIPSAAPSSKEQTEPSVASPLTDLFEKHRAAYETKTAETLETLKTLHTNNDSSPIKDQIQMAWGSSQTLKPKIERLNNILQLAVRDWDSATLIRTSKPDKNSGQLILKDLRALAAMAKNLAKHIESMETSDSQALNTQEKQQAITLANNVIGPKIHSLLTDRRTTIASYEQAITFIGETANPKQPSTK